MTFRFSKTVCSYCDEQFTKNNCSIKINHKQHLVSTFFKCFTQPASHKRSWKLANQYSERLAITCKWLCMDIDDCKIINVIAGVVKWLERRNCN